ncbi:MAG: M56 family metallopeptidase, partial [Planctomycetota bacterium]
MPWLRPVVELVWSNLWAVCLAALAAAAICRWLPCRPVTRHGVWLLVLVWVLVVPLLPTAPSAAWLERVIEFNGAAATPQSAGAMAPELLGDSRPRAPGDGQNMSGGGPAPRNDQAVAAAATERRSADLPRPAGTAPRPPAATAMPSGRKMPTVAAWATRSSEDRAPLTADDMPSAFTFGPKRAERVSPVAAARPIRLAPRARLRVPSADAPSTPPAVGNKLALVPESGGAERGTASRDRLRAWCASLLALRAVLADLPALPVPVWFAGVVLIVFWNASWLFWFRTRLRRAYATPRWVTREVGIIACRLGLRRAPEVRMVGSCVSPLLWCGLRPRLILPVRLWNELDAAGRRAILCHELAHLRRCDHWVRWLELLASAVYWWHPVVWWARRRIHEEADMCCDAWVTWLMPGRRRAYAEALLRTKAYITRDGHVPAAGVAVLTPNARRFAKRLTMVMTQTVRPRHSYTGLTLGAVLLVAGWLATPAVSSPPRGSADEPQTTETTVTTTVTKTPAEEIPPVETPRARKRHGATPRPGAVGAVRVWSQEPPDTPPPPPPPKPAQAAKPPRPPKALKGLKGPRVLAPTPAVPAVPGEAPAPTVPAVPAMPAMPAVPPAPDMPLLPAPAPDAPGGVSVPHPAPPGWPHAAGGGGGGGASTFDRFLQGRREAPAAIAGGEGVIVRQYRLPKGRLEAFTTLMIREDVPIRVRPVEDALEVHATAAQHEIIAAFVKLLEDGEAHEGVHGFFVPAPQPFAVVPGPHGAQGGWGGGGAAQVYVWPGRAARKAQLERLRAQAAELDAQADALREQAEELRAESERVAEQANEVESGAQRSLERQARELERAAGRLERQAERLEQRGREIESRADELEDADDKEGEARTQREAALAELYTAQSLAALDGEPLSDLSRLEEETGGIAGCSGEDVAAALDAA